MFVETALFNYYTVLDLEDVRLQLRTFEDTHMQIKFWLSTIVNSILKRFPRGMSRHQRLKRRLGLRASVAVLTVVATIPLLEHTAAGQCEGPLFPEVRFDTGDSPRFVATGDFNGDGLTDLVTANIGTCLLYTSPSPRD